MTEPLHTFNTADHVGSLQDVLSRLVLLVELLLILQGLLERLDQLLELFTPGLQLLRGDHGLLLLRLQVLESLHILLVGLHQHGVNASHGLDLLSLQLRAFLISLSWGLIPRLN